MDKIVFMNCAVAFLDILGFKDFIVKAENSCNKEYQEFYQLQKVIRRQLIFTNDDGNKQHLFPKAVGLKCIYISDSFILSAPMGIEGHAAYSGLVAVSIKAIQLAHQLLKMGFLLRGGIAVGNVYRTDKNIFGTGYQHAYETEAQSARNPRILLHPSATRFLECDHHFGIKTASMSIFMKDGSEFILDTLNTHWSYVGNNRNYNKYDVYCAYKEEIENRMARITNGDARQKWEWMARLFNAKRNDASDLFQIPSIDIDKNSSFTFGNIDSTETFQEAFAPFIAKPKYVKILFSPETPED